MITPRREKLIVGIMLLAYLGLALGFSFGPVLEGAEELEHYRFVRTLVRTHALPDPYKEWGGQYHQAPLYYVLLAPVKILVADPDFTALSTRVNPFYGYAFTALGNDNKNLYLHARDETFPFRHGGTALAVFLMRLVSISLGLETVLASYALFRTLWPNRPEHRVLALGVVAFHPHFVQVTATVNNDNLLFLLATLSLWLVLRQMRTGPSWRRAAVLGLVLGAALLTKVNATFLVFPVGLVTLLSPRTWRYALLTLGIVAVVAGWWYVRNQERYGDPTGSNVLFTVTQPGEAIRAGKLTPEIGWPRLRFAYQTFWARFGDGRVSVADPIYTFYDGLVLAAAGGLAIWLLRALASAYAARKHQKAVDNPLELPHLGVIAVYGVSWIALLFYYSSRAWSGVQGRYLLPGIAGWGALIACGILAWIPQRGRWIAALGGSLALGGAAAICVFGYYLPAYRVSPVPQHAAQPVYYAYEGQAELIGMAPAVPRARPGETIRLTLYWRALRPTQGELQAYLHTVEAPIVRRDSYPATGNLLSSDWKPGETWAEHYVVEIPKDAAPQQVYTLIAGLYDPAAKRTLAAQDASGQAATPVIGWIAINGPEQPFTPDYRFGNVIGLAGPTLNRQNGQLRLCFRWLSLAPAPVDYHVFVHVTAADGTPITQTDFQPRGGAYPTRAWSPGEAIDDCITLDAPGLPETGWQAAIGLYNLEDGARLPVRGPQGQRLPDDQLVVSP